MIPRDHIRVSLVIAAVFVFFAAYPTPAEGGDGPWRLRVSGLMMNPTGDTVFVPESGEKIAYDGGSGYGFGVDLEYQASRRIGIDFGVLSATPVIDVLIDEVGVISASAEPRITPVFAAFNIHLTPNGPVDVYVGPLLAYVFYSSFDLVVDPWFLTEEGFTSDDDIGVGVSLGLDVRLGERGWLLNAAFKYIDTTMVASAPDGGIGKTDIDPMIFSVGVGYRF